MIEVTLLGTGSPIPDARRAGPSTLVRAGGRIEAQELLGREREQAPLRGPVHG